MSYQITTLVENCVYGRKLKAEHGLSLYIELPGYRLLFDTGASDLFLRNARLLHIDLSEVDYLVLSHGHSDHSGGLRYFLERNSRATVVCKKEAFLPKFKDDKEKGMRENGIRAKQAAQWDLSRFRFVDRREELVPGVFLFPSVAIADREDTHFERFWVDDNGQRKPDCFPDELSLTLLTPSCYSVLSACSHRGITNLLREVKAAFPRRSCDLVLGGFHIHNAESRKYELIADYLNKDLPRRIGVCHCSGVDAHASFCRDFGDRVFYNYTGRETRIDDF